ncbi:MAG TPA: hypothetical protein VLK65_00520 [Vicinamibacteria bacterium]|nr:hypothetical protein [Vicinamibacteria bacterium]
MRLFIHRESRLSFLVLTAIVTWITVQLLGLHPAHAQEPRVRDVLEQEEDPGPYCRLCANAAFADMQLENFAERERIWYHPTIRLRYDATPDQVRYVLVQVRKLLYSNPRVDPDPARVRFIGYGDSSLDLEVFAYVRTTDWSDYLEVAEDLNLRILDIIVQAGTALAYPTRTVSLERGNQPTPEAAKRAEAKVNEWRDRNQLYLPRFPDEKISQLRGTVPYPPEGSVGWG